MHAAGRPDVSLERVTDGDVAVDGRGDENVRGGKHGHHLYVRHHLAQRVRPVESQRYLPRHLHQTTHTHTFNGPPFRDYPGGLCNERKVTGRAWGVGVA